MPPPSRRLPYVMVSRRLVVVRAPLRDQRSTNVLPAAGQELCCVAHRVWRQSRCSRTIRGRPQPDDGYAIARGGSCHSLHPIISMRWPQQGRRIGQRVWPDTRRGVQKVAVGEDTVNRAGSASAGMVIQDSRALASHTTSLQQPARRGRRGAAENGAHGAAGVERSVSRR